jgi:hypothetical protein
MAVQLAVVRVGCAWDLVDWKVLQHGELLKNSNCSVVAEMVALKEGCAISADCKSDEPTSAGMALDEVRDIVSCATVYCPF